MKQTIKLFQARHVDADGRPLKQDGEVGSITWEVLFAIVRGHEVNDASEWERCK